MQPCMQEAEEILQTAAGADVIQFFFTFFKHLCLYIQNNPSPFIRKKYVCASLKSQS